MDQERDAKYLQSNTLIEQKESFSIYEYRIFYIVLRKLYIKEAAIKMKLKEARTEEENRKYKDKLSDYERQFTIKELCKDENRTYTIYMSEFLDVWDLDYGNAYKYVSQVIKKIMQKTAAFEFKKLTLDGKDSSSIAAMFEKAYYVDGEGLFTVTVTPSIMPYIAALDTEFTIMLLNEVSKIRTASAMRLYELLLQYKTIGSRSFPIAEFCNKMYVSEKYAERRDNLAKRVIEPALEEIQKTNIKATYKFEGRGKRTIVRFDIFENRRANSRSLISKAKDLVGEEYAQLFIDFLEEKIADKKITNKKAYMSKMIEESKDKLLAEFAEIKKSKEAARRREEDSLLDHFYRKIQEDAEKELEKRRLEVFSKSGELRDVVDRRNKLMPYMASVILKGDTKIDDEYYTKDRLEGEINRLSSRYEELLTGLGYEIDYLDRKYRCTLCNDTGTKNEDGSRCSCRAERLREARKE